MTDPFGEQVSFPLIVGICSNEICFTIALIVIRYAAVKNVPCAAVKLDGLLRLVVKILNFLLLRKICVSPQKF